MADDIPTVATKRVRGAATGQQNVPVQPEQFDRWLESVEAAAEQRGAKAERERIARNIEAAKGGAVRGTRPLPRSTLGVYDDAARIARESA